MIIGAGLYSTEYHLGISTEFSDCNNTYFIFKSKVLMLCNGTILYCIYVIDRNEHIVMPGWVVYWDWDKMKHDWGWEDGP